MFFGSVAQCRAVCLPAALFLTRLITQSVTQTGSHLSGGHRSIVRCVSGARYHRLGRGAQMLIAPAHSSTPSAAGRKPPSPARKQALHAAPNSSRDTEEEEGGGGGWGARGGSHFSSRPLTSDNNKNRLRRARGRATRPSSGLGGPGASFPPQGTPQQGGQEDEDHVQSSSCS